MSYKVVAPCVMVTKRDGGSEHKYAGTALSWLHESDRHLLDKGQIAEVPDSLPPGVAEEQAPSPGGQAVESAPAAARPAATAPKDRWVAYVVASGAANQAEAEALSKDDLIKLAG